MQDLRMRWLSLNIGHSTPGDKSEGVSTRGYLEHDADEVELSGCPALLRWISPISPIGGIPSWEKEGEDKEMGGQSSNPSPSPISKPPSSKNNPALETPVPTRPALGTPGLTPKTPGFISLGYPRVISRANPITCNLSDMLEEESVDTVSVDGVDADVEESSRGNKEDLSEEKERKIRCFRCEKKIGQKAALHMYKDVVFCKEQCRNHQMDYDSSVAELNHAISETFKGNYFPVSPISVTDTKSKLSKYGPVFQTVFVRSFVGTHFMRNLGFSTILLSLPYVTTTHPFHTPSPGEIIAGFMRWRSSDTDPYIHAPVLLCYGSKKEVEALPCTRSPASRITSISIAPILPVLSQTLT
ncbi:hypothetical protein AAMO2058_000382900 [Amorphochlora amoebiformis]